VEETARKIKIDAINVNFIVEMNEINLKVPTEA
jgi:hypothetical protein